MAKYSYSRAIAIILLANTVICGARAVIFVANTFIDGKNEVVFKCSYSKIQNKYIGMFANKCRLKERTKRRKKKEKKIS